MTKNAMTTNNADDEKDIDREGLTHVFISDNEPVRLSEALTRIGLTPETTSKEEIEGLELVVNWWRPFQSEYEGSDIAYRISAVVLKSGELVNFSVSDGAVMDTLRLYQRVFPDTKPVIVLLQRTSGKGRDYWAVL